MAIFQPTNILPDLLAGTAAGTVFYDPNNLAADVEISWQVNGNSPLTAYQIDFYKNNTASTPTTSTGKITLSPAFSAVSADGTETRFSCKVPVSTFVNAADSSGGYTGKFKITQWWSASDSVVQRSLTVFRVNGISSVSVAFASLPGSCGVYNFSGTFAPPNPDHFDTSLLWTRWQLSRSDGVVIQDTGKVWGATSYEWTCQQLLPKMYYQVVFSAMTSMGELIESDPLDFDYLEDETVVTYSNAVKAVCDKSGVIFVQVRYADAIRGVSAPNPDFSTYVDEYARVVLPSGATATWNIPGSISASQWGIAWVGNRPYNGTVVSVTQADGTVFDLHMKNGAAYINPGDVFVAGISNIVETVYFFLTVGTGSDANTWYLYVGTEISGTYTYYRKPLSNFTQSAPVQVEFGGGTTTKRCRIVYGNQTELANWAVTGGDIAHTTDDEPHIDIPYTDNYDYASEGLAIVEYFGSNLRAGALFRKVNAGNMEYFAPLTSPSLSTMYQYRDYGVANDNQYEYVVVHQYDADATPSEHFSGTVSPCWWEWTLIEAEKNASGSGYTPVQAFRFSMNIASGQDGNGSSPGVYSNFTPYPIVMRDTTNRHSGTLSGLIGYLSAPGVYEDTNLLRDQVRALSVSKNALFLRSRRGDLFRVEISGEISTSVDDTSPKQQLAVSIPWVETGPVDGQIYMGGAVPNPIGGGSL